MGSDVRHVRGEAQKELVKKFEVFTSKGRSRWQVWSDWITISAIAVSNATDKSHFDEREQQYMTIVKKYTKQEVDTFADMFSILVMALEDNSEQDFLGELYMCLGLGSDHAGQFFTPYHLCEFMSAVTTPAEEFQQKIGDRGWVAVCDPTCGAGALLVAFANECRKKGINYQTDVLFVAQDIDYIVGTLYPRRIGIRRTKGCAFPTTATILWKSAPWMGTEWLSAESAAPPMAISSLCFRRQRQRRLTRWALMGASVLKETAKRPFSVTTILR